ncbi:peroxide stress protein YaaA [Microbacterium sp. LRZ72]|uniref:YaaA family protein n=1 Tax=Microbacterium sp. LRZ72 TaxID=2942481 RepID=UPI0029B2B2E5|nr:peroxide stress protein YaaA [Microbacterium sp. LRZ72]MDX2377367.1 peroxide stress protein YaaA [Microbacterium sp. LRZ72]
MLLLLPPSESKTPGGEGPPVDLDRLALPSLTPVRHGVLRAIRDLSRDEENAIRTLKLGARQRGQVRVNAEVLSAATRPAVLRYTGVLYDALDAASLDDAASSFLDEHVLIHTACLGPVRACDPIPDYRLGPGVRLPTLPTPRRLWADAVTTAFRAHGPTLVVDLRSEAYVALGPVPADVSSVYVRVLAEDGAGRRRALNHFNKAAKGHLTRALARQRPELAEPADLYRWAERAGIRLTPAEHEAGEAHLLV